MVASVEISSLVGYSGSLFFFSFFWPSNVLIVSSLPIGVSQTSTNFMSYDFQLVGIR